MTIQSTMMANTRLSISGMRRYAACVYAFKLHRDGAPRRLTAAIWYGSIVHRIVERAYAGAALRDAHEQVWAEECGSILAALDAWSDLQLAYLASGTPTPGHAQPGWPPIRSMARLVSSWLRIRPTS